MTGRVCLVEFNNLPGNTLDLIKAAERTGHDVVILTSAPNAAAKVLPPHVEIQKVDTKDGAAIAASAHAQKAIGLLTPHDFYVPATAEAAAILGLPGPDPAAVWRCRRKDQQRDRMAEFGVHQPRYGVAGTPENAVKVARAIGFPVIVKPVALADSIGVMLCEDSDSVAAHVRDLITSPRFRPRRPAPGFVPGEVMIESLLIGPEYSVEVFNGRAVAVAQTFHSPPPGFVEAEHIVTAPGDPATAIPHHRLRQTAEQAVASLNLGSGPAHVELRLTDRGPAIVEVNSRLAGGRMPRLHQVAYGIDLWEATLNVALGRKEELRINHDRAAMMRFVQVAHSQPMQTQQITRGDFSGELFLLETLPTVGERPTRSSESAGWAIATGITPDECREQLNELWVELEKQLPIWNGPTSRSQ